MPLIGAKRAIVLARSRVLWTPLNLGGALVEWWDPTFGITFGSGAAVAGWSGRKGLVASQATTANQPTFSAAARNGRPGIVFGGSQILTFATATLPLGSSPGTIFVAGYISNSGDTGPIGYGNASSMSWRYVTQSNNDGQAVKGGFYGSDLPSSGVIWQGNDRAVALNIAAGAQALFVDGASKSSAAITPNTAGSTGGIGGFATGGGRVTGAIQQIVLTNTMLSAPLINKMFGWESWANGKAGANLPAGHPYKSRPPVTSDP